MASTADRKALLDKVRKRLKDKRGGFQKDPNEWRAPKVAEDGTWKAKCFVLPSVTAGDKVASGIAELSMDELLPFIPVGDHWFNKKKYPCPRVYDGDECPMCDFGFSLFADCSDKQMRKDISSKYLPRTYQAVNLYFPKIKSNPEELQGKVMFASLAKTIADKLDECLNRDSGGDDPDEPLPFGIFWDENEAYPLLIKIKHKGGYNDYTDTKLLPKLQPIGNDDDDITEVLAMRHDVASKFGKRDSENRKSLQKLVDQILNGDDDKDDDKDSGFDSDENETKAESKPEPEPEPEPEKSKGAKKSTKKSSARAKKAPDPEPEAVTESVLEDSEEDGDDLKDLLSKIENGDME